MFNRNSRVSLLSAVCLLTTSGGVLAQQTVVSGGSTLSGPFYLDEIAQFPLPTFKPYVSVGSGTGKFAFLTNNAAYLGSSGAVHWIASESILTRQQIVDYLSPAGLGKYGNPAGHGPLIQIPAMATPVTISYKGPTGTVTLTKAQLCGLASGKYTRWSELGVAVPAGLDHFKFVFRIDSSGTTELLTRHLQAVCGVDSSIAFTGKSVFAQEFPGGVLPANFMQAAGSSGVASVMGAQVSAITYLGPDPAYTATLKQANLRNSNDNVAYSPTAANVDLALETSGSAGLPGSAPTVTDPNALGWDNINNAGNPANWVRLSANPMQGYPISGRSNLVLSQCYASAAVAADIKNFLVRHYAPNILLDNHKLVPLSPVYRAAITRVFVTGDAKNLNIGNATVCANYAGRE
ncbi:substrate-binding domain-containing protein [Achromobacter sp. Marseille-Q0513]|uniref:substrate-binding domain-containing protein n=1 Tax=Achromobacter sp. Marseille-Q0513 TaxID=2829161 RepID=UPI001BA354F1|nr:substrate-binding domain-containing protein [Achromobacter sp. Marseille-Q0513]MBR8654487.1 substrate-binding domain-containing protein [Achromobacter sp. Marseille-Q0513]